LISLNQLINPYFTKEIFALLRKWFQDCEKAKLKLNSNGRRKQKNTSYLISMVNMMQGAMVSNSYMAELFAATLNMNVEYVDPHLMVLDTGNGVVTLRNTQSTPARIVISGFADDIAVAGNPADLAGFENTSDIEDSEIHGEEVSDIEDTESYPDEVWNHVEAEEVD